MSFSDTVSLFYTLAWLAPAVVAGIFAYVMYNDGK